MGEAWSSVVNPVVEVLEEGTELFQVNIKGEGGATIRARSEKEAIAKAFKKMRIANRFTNDKKFMSGVKVVPAESVETDEDSLQEKMNPTDHVKEKDGKFCVYNADGSVAKEFDNKADADKYAIANHDKLMATQKEDASNDDEDDGEGLDKADPKAAKKKFKDRKDKDIDNDGDVDSSDKFLHKRRKAIGKAMDGDDNKKKKVVGNDGEKKAEISKIGEATDELLNMLETTFSELQEFGKVGRYIVTAGPGDNAQKVIGIEKDQSKAEKIRDDWNKKNKPSKPSHRARVYAQTELSSTKSDIKVGKDISWSSYGNKLAFKKIKEELSLEETAAKQQKSNATKPEEIMDKESPKSKEFANAHKKSDKKIEDNVEDAKDKTTKAGQATKAKSGKRPQDNSAGDTQVVKSTEAPVKEDVDMDAKEGSVSLVDMARDVLSGKTMSELRQELGQKEKNPHDARTTEAKKFLERMAKRRGYDKKDDC